MGKVFKGLVSLVTGGKKPKMSSAARIDVESERDKSRKRRSSQFKTKGGIIGEELNPEQVARRDTLLGN